MSASTLVVSASQDDLSILLQSSSITSSPATSPTSHPHIHNNNIINSDTNTNTHDNSNTLAYAGYKSDNKPLASFRNYQTNSKHLRIRNHFKNMRSNQTVEFVNKMEEKYFKFVKCEMSIWEAFDLLNDYVDSSDPDSDSPNLFHMLQVNNTIHYLLYILLYYC